MSMDWDPAIGGDGCTLWFDTWRGINLRPCCDVHDEAFATGYTLYEFVQANVALVQCGIGLGAWDWALLAGIGVFSPVAVYLFFWGKKRDGRTNQAGL